MICSYSLMKKYLRITFISWSILYYMCIVIKALTCTHMHNWTGTRIRTARTKGSWPNFLQSSMESERYLKLFQKRKALSTFINQCCWRPHPLQVFKLVHYHQGSRIVKYSIPTPIWSMSHVQTYRSSLISSPGLLFFYRTRIGRLLIKEGY